MDKCISCTAEISSSEKLKSKRFTENFMGSKGMEDLRTKLCENCLDTKYCVKSHTLLSFIGLSASCDICDFEENCIKDRSYKLEIGNVIKPSNVSVISQLKIGDNVWSCYPKEPAIPLPEKRMYTLKYVYDHLCGDEIGNYALISENDRILYFASLTDNGINIVMDRLKNYIALHQMDYYYKLISASADNPLNCAEMVQAIIDYKISDEELDYIIDYIKPLPSNPEDLRKIVVRVILLRRKSLLNSF